jgi:hypothetical protein
MNDIARGDVDSLAVMLNKIAPESLGAWWDWPGGFRQINLTRYPHLVSDENLTDPASSGKNFLSEPVVAKYLQNPKRLWQSLADDQDCGISTLIRDLAKHLSLEKREAFLRGQLGSLGKQGEVLLREQFVDSSAEEEARKRRKFGTSLAKDLEAAKAPRLVMAALRKTLKVDESLASRARASLQKDVGQLLPLGTLFQIEPASHAG